MTLIIMIPAGVRTGGPEALHQLSDALIRLGVDARTWYVSSEEIAILRNLKPGAIIGPHTRLEASELRSEIPEYAVYRVKPLGTHTLNTEDVLILPETYADFAKVFHGVRLVVWWLSVDNSFEFLARINLNYLRKSNILHAWQSAYAQEFISALALGPAIPLTDYTPEYQPRGEDANRSMICLNAGHKVIYDIVSLAANIEAETGVPTKLIRGMTRDQVYDALEHSFLYVDLASFPGKDRMPREALLRGCCLALSRSGAGAWDDFKIPEFAIFDDSSISYIAHFARECSSNYRTILSNYQTALNMVQSERLNFYREAAQLIKRIQQI